MAKSSTLTYTPSQQTSVRPSATPRRGPSVNCISRLRQFAHAYCPTPLGGIIMN